MMIWNLTQIILALGPPPGGQQPTAPWYIQLFPFFLLIVVFYLVLIRPQQKKAREHDALIKNLRTGDKVVTSSGIIGTIVGVKEKSISIRSADTKLEILKSAVTEVTERSGESSQS